MKNNVLCVLFLLFSIILVSSFSLADLDMSVTVETDQNVTYQQTIFADGDVISQHDIIAGGESIIIVNGVDWTQYNPNYIASSELKWGDNGLDTKLIAELMEKLESYRNGEDVELTTSEYNLLMSLLSLSDAEIVDFYNSQISPILDSHYNQILTNMYEIEAAYRTFEKLYPDVYCESRQEVMKKYGLKSVTCGLHSKRCYNGKFYPHEGGFDYCVYTEGPEEGMGIHLKDIKIYDSEEKSLTAFVVELYNQGENGFKPVLKADINKLENKLGHFEQELEELKPGESKTYYVAWDNTGIEPGDYTAKATIYLGKKEILEDVDFTILPKGSLVKNGEIVSVELKNEPLTFNEVVIETQIKNYGDVPTAFKVSGEVYIDGEKIGTTESAYVLIKPGETEPLLMGYKLQDMGEYEVEVKSNENMQDTIVFEAVPTTVTGRFLSSPGPGLFAFLLILVAGLYGARFFIQRMDRKGTVGVIEFVKPLPQKIKITRKATKARKKSIKKTTKAKTSRKK